MRLALPASAILHVALIGGAWMALNWAPPPEETGVESVSVDIVSLEEFTSTEVSTAVSSATETLVAAGAEAVEPVTVSPSAAAVALVAPEAKVPLKVASVQPQAVRATEVEPLEPIEEIQPDLAAPQPLPRPDLKTEPTKKAEPQVEKPTKKAEPKEQKKPAASGGSGGKSNATVAASAASGGKGASDASGNASASKYPGLVQRALRRALRFPKGAGSARGEVHVTFVVSSSGAASGISVTRSSGHAVLDKEAMATVRRAKFPPIPDGAGRSNWTFTMPLAFER